MSVFFFVLFFSLFSFVLFFQDECCSAGGMLSYCIDQVNCTPGLSTLLRDYGGFILSYVSLFPNQNPHANDRHCFN